MSKDKWVPVGQRIMDIGWMRDGDTIHTGEALLLACLFHAKGKSRKSDDMRELQRIMKDGNLDSKARKGKE